MNWYQMAWKKYSVFEGRSRRKEYWIFGLFNLGAIILLVLIDRATGTFSEAAGLGALSGLYALAALVPSIAVSIRRMHDTGRSGWWVLLGIVPLLNLVLLVLAALDSQPGNNAYGPNPKGVPGAASA